MTLDSWRSRHDGRELNNQTFPIDVDTLFQLLFSNSKFFMDFHTARKTLGNFFHHLCSFSAKKSISLHSNYFFFFSCSKCRLNNELVWTLKYLNALLDDSLFDKQNKVLNEANFYSSSKHLSHQFHKSYQFQLKIQFENETL